MSSLSDILLTAAYIGVGGLFLTAASKLLDRVNERVRRNRLAEWEAERQAAYRAGRVEIERELDSRGVHIGLGPRGSRLSGPAPEG